jgi:hypothetical protein
MTKNSNFSSKLGPIPQSHFDNDTPPPDEATLKSPLFEQLSQDIDKKKKPTGEK